MKIVGFVGKKGSGKDEAGRALADLNFLSVAYGDGLKHVCSNVWGLSPVQMYDPTLKEVVDDRWGLTPRQILQRLGSDVARNIHPDTWVRYLMNQIKNKSILVPSPNRTSPINFCVKGASEKYAVVDVRFQNEAQAILDNGGVLIRIVRPSLKSVDEHISETEGDDIEVNSTILNDSTLEVFHQRVVTTVCLLLEIP